MPTRNIHLVGSLPPEITQNGIAEAMTWVLQQVHTIDRLNAVPVDQDDRWIIQFLESLIDRPGFAALREGDSADYDTMPIYRPVGKLGTSAVALDRLDYLTSLMQAHQSHGLHNDGLPLQISMPNPLDLALFVFAGKPQWRKPIRTLNGARLVLRYLSVFEQAMRDEVESILQRKQEIGFPGKLAFQLETPAVLYALNLVPAPLRPMLAKILAKQVARMIGLLPEEAVWLHLCYGDLGDKAVIEPKTVRPAVLFLNELARLVKVLPPVHLPIAFGDQPPPTDPAFYEPLEGLDRAWKLVAGVVDENDPAASERALELLEAASGRTTLAVATACGLGRHSAEDAIAAIALMKELATR